MDVFMRLRIFLSRSQRPGDCQGRASPKGTALLALLVAVLANLPVASGQAAELLTIERVVEIARQQSPEILAARQEVGVARGRLEKARYWNPFNPEIEGGAAQRRFDGGSGEQRSGALALEVEIAGQRGKRTEEAQRNLARVEAEVADTERLVIASVKQAFYHALYLRRRLHLFREVEQLNQRLRDASVSRFESGGVAKLEANLAIVRHSQSRKDTLAAARDYHNGVRELERLLGAEPTGTTELDGKLAVMPVAGEPTALVQEALEVRPDLRVREAEIERLEAETALTKRLVVPNPTLRATYDEETESAGSLDRIIGGGVSIPLPVFDRKQGELTALAAARTRAGYQRTSTMLAVKAEVLDAYRSYEAAREGVDLFESDAAERIAENFRFIETAYREGKIDLLQLVVVQNDLVGVQFSYLDSLWDYWLARVALERAVGEPLEKET